ncbi:hypothetical protein [Campylobacter lari]|nr:hypothetical protein [Campylobacter lari]MCR6542326.1 hypothetical protein [Campylobacter lari]
MIFKIYQEFTIGMKNKLAEMKNYIQVQIINLHTNTIKELKWVF